MAKKVFYDDEARARVLGGAKMLADAVREARPELHSLGRASGHLAFSL